MPPRYQVGPSTVSDRSFAMMASEAAFKLGKLNKDASQWLQDLIQEVQRPPEPVAEGVTTLHAPLQLASLRQHERETAKEKEDRKDKKDKRDKDKKDKKGKGRDKKDKDNKRKGSKDKDRGRDKKKRGKDSGPSSDSSSTSNTLRGGGGGGGASSPPPSSSRGRSSRSTSSSSSGSSTSCASRPKDKKELEPVKIPSLPDIHNVERWTFRVCEILCVASGKVDIRPVIKWFNKTFRKGTTVEDLMDEGKFPTLGRKLGLALGEKFSGEFGTQGTST